MGIDIIVILIMLSLSAFFSGLESAFLSANKLRVELMSNQGERWAVICSNYMKQPSKFISTILMGNNIALVLYSITMEEMLRPTLTSFSPATAVLVATGISTVIVLITAEFMPKALFRINPTGVLSVLIYPFQLCYVLLWPLVKFTLWLSKTSLYILLRQRFTEESPAFSKLDLDHYLSETKQSDDETQEVDTEIIKNALDFGSVRVRECMVPRTQLVAVEVNDTIQELTDTFKESHHSKILVYRESIDHIIGYVHHFDMFKKPATIKSILKPILITNESKPAHELLKEFTTTGKSIALVVDEFGGTAGIITAEDIMEEIFGEIEDEHDDDDGIIEEKINEDTYRFSTSLEIDYLNEQYDLNLPIGEYETLGGFIIAYHESIPQVGETIVLENFEIQILKADEKRIELVQLSTINE
jgi:CBS domain containing-hemolysin-like protein